MALAVAAGIGVVVLIAGMCSWVADVFAHASELRAQELHEALSAPPVTWFDGEWDEP